MNTLQKALGIRFVYVTVPGKYEHDKNAFLVLRNEQGAIELRHATSTGCENGYFEIPHSAERIPYTYETFVSEGCEPYRYVSRAPSSVVLTNYEEERIRTLLASEKERIEEELRRLHEARLKSLFALISEENVRSWLLSLDGGSVFNRISGDPKETMKPFLRSFWESQPNARALLADVSSTEETSLLNTVCNTARRCINEIRTERKARFLESGSRAKGSHGYTP